MTFRRGNFHCYRCSAEGDVVKLIVGLRGCSYAVARTLSENAPRLVQRMPGTMLRQRPEADRLPYPVFPESSIAPYRSSCPVYLIGRGFRQDTLRAYDVGYDHHSARIVIPARDWAGRIAGVTYRLDFDDPGRPKYWHDLWKSVDHLYGLHKWAFKDVPELHLVEGQLDAQRMFQLGVAAVAVMGARLYEAQIEVLSRCAATDTVVLSFDNDGPGASARDQAKSLLLKTRFAKKLRVGAFPGHDPGELQRREQLTSHPWYEVAMPSRFRA